MTLKRDQTFGRSHIYIRKGFSKLIVIIIKIVFSQLLGHAVGKQVFGCGDTTLV